MSEVGCTVIAVLDRIASTRSSLSVLLSNRAADKSTPAQLFGDNRVRPNTLRAAGINTGGRQGLRPRQRGGPHNAGPCRAQAGPEGTGQPCAAHGHREERPLRGHGAGVACQFQGTAGRGALVRAGKHPPPAGRWARRLEGATGSSVSRSVCDQHPSSSHHVQGQPRGPRARVGTGGPRARPRGRPSEPGTHCSPSLGRTRRQRHAFPLPSVHREVAPTVPLSPLQPRAAAQAARSSQRRSRSTARFQGAPLLP